MLNQIPYRNFSIDIVGSCNLRCPSCAVGNTRQKSDTRFTKFMDFELYKQIVTKIQNNYVDGPLFDGRTPQISLHDWGEPTLHPLLPEFIEFARQHGCDVGFSSNFNTSPDWERILLANPNHIKISLSSLDADTYSLTHRRGKLSKVLENIETVVKMRENLSSDVNIIMNYHVYAHNLKSDFDKVSAFCKQKGIMFNPELAIFMPIEKIVAFRRSQDQGNVQINDDDNKIIGSLLLQPLDQYKFWKKSKAIRKAFSECRRQTHKMPIRADGSVPIWCGVYDGEFTVSQSFLEEDVNEIQKRREQFSFCGTCVSVGAHASYSVGRRGVLINRLLLRDDFIGKITRRIKHRPLRFSKI